MTKKSFTFIKNPDDFKEINKQQWNNNTDYWIKGELRQVIDTKDFLKQKLEALFLNYDKDYEFNIYDFGFGNCWLLELLFEIKIKFKYVGFDFNKKFIEIYSETYTKFPNVKFVYQDLEEPISDDFLNKADIVFTLFSLFEIPRVDKVFKNISNCLKNNGKNLLLTID